jgi:NitT/TauT family transport system substrate-binding protein
MRNNNSVLALVIFVLSLPGMLLFSAVAPVQSQSQKTVTIAYPTLVPLIAGLWMAKEIGAFEKYGQKAELLFISSGPTTVQAMIGGHLDVSIAASNAVVNSILAGAPLIAVGSVTNRPAMSLWVQPEITKPEQLEGKTMGVTRLGSTTHFLTLMVIEKLGLKNKVKIQPFGGGTEADSAFRAGIVAARVGSIRPGPKALMMLDLAKSDIPFSMDLIAVKRDFHKSSPRTIEGILRAYIEGVVAMRTNKPRAHEVIGKYMRLRPEVVGEQTMTENYNYAYNSIDIEPRVEPAVIETVLNWAGKSNARVEDFFDNTTVDRILQEGFINDLYKKGGK